MPVELNGNEREQILQTVEMFEVITQANPDDYQSLDLLREAYVKLSKTGDVVRVSRMLADAYTHSGQISEAVRTLDFILKEDPEQPEVFRLRKELGARMKEDGDAPGPDPDHALIKTDLTGEQVKAVGTALIPEGDDGNDAMGRYLLGQQLVTIEALHEVLEKVRRHNDARGPQEIGRSLLEEVLRQATLEQEEEVFMNILDHAGVGYIPLEHCEVDRQVLKMLPDEFTLGRLFVPFDLISRTLLIATCNPFDEMGREAVQRSLDYNILWYFATPKAATRTLTEGYRLSGKG